jgi:four helix bundle protein
VFTAYFLEMKYKKFEDVEVWQLARSYTTRIYKLTEKGSITKDFSLRDQIRRTAVSVMANIAEGYERRSNKEFIQFLYIAKGSAGESRSHLYIASDLNYINNDEFLSLQKEILKISRSLGGFIKYLKEN